MGTAGALADAPRCPQYIDTCPRPVPGIVTSSAHGTWGFPSTGSPTRFEYHHTKLMKIFFLFGGNPTLFLFLFLCFGYTFNQTVRGPRSRARSRTSPCPYRTPEYENIRLGFSRVRRRYPSLCEALRLPPRCGGLIQYVYRLSGPKMPPTNTEAVLIHRALLPGSVPFCYGELHVLLQQSKRN